jgi:hypothetical protein
MSPSPSIACPSTSSTCGECRRACSPDVFVYQCSGVAVGASCLPRRLGQGTRRARGAASGVARRNSGGLCRSIYPSVVLGQCGLPAELTGCVPAQQQAPEARGGSLPEAHLPPVRAPGQARPVGRLPCASPPPPTLPSASRRLRVGSEAGGSGRPSLLLCAPPLL